MSGEYFSSRESPERNKTDDCIGKKTEMIYLNNRKDGDGMSVVINKNDERLHEMGEQLQIAETRCNTLKSQLDQMKKLYQKPDEKPVEFKISQRPTRRAQTSKSKSVQNSSTAKLIRTSHSSKDDSSPTWRSSAHEQKRQISPARQNSVCIGTDRTGAAVNTINNILNGITTSVNRLSELHASIEKENKPVSAHSIICHNNQRRLDENAAGVEMVHCIPRSANSEDQPDKITEIRKNSSDTINEKKRINKKRTKSRTSSAAGRNSSNDIILGGKKSSNKSTVITPSITANVNAQKRIKLNKPEEVEAAEELELIPSTTTFRHRKQLKRLKPSSRTKLTDRNVKGSSNLVELYHNVAAKGGSDSEDSQIIHPSSSKTCREKTTSNVVAVVPPIAIERDVFATHIEEQDRILSPIAENGYQETTEDRTDYCSNYSHNYELPTIASKMKQVAKSYVHQYNYRTIPFCVATSTSPSHNIGINIQQVMSIMKTRQPFNGISPTLAHNIGIAAEKLHSTPYSAIVSSISSKIIYGKSQCPLMLKNNYNYNQMQELAKEIPEETEAQMMIDDGHCNEALGSVYQQEMAHGDANRYQNTAVTSWSMDHTKSTCTCVKPSGIGFQQVASKYQNCNSTVASASVMQYNSKLASRQSRMLQQRPSTVVNPERNKTQQNVQNWVEERSSNPNLKENNLKGVLTNLHDEFEDLNKKYDALSKKINNGRLGGSREAHAELARMEKSLCDKEEEIKMVMGLYKEVVALKGQVKMLKEEASQASIYIQQHQQYQNQVHQQQSQSHYAPASRPSRRFKEYKDPLAAIHLTKLLKQIQTYQEFYRHGR